VPLSLWTAIRVISMLGEDSSQQFNGAVEELLRTLIKMMRDQRFLFELQASDTTTLRSVICAPIVHDRGGDLTLT
jgi:hypothetical protein